MKRGKPHERETQIMVGELGYGNKNGFQDRKIDKCLSPKGTEHGLCYYYFFKESGT